MEKDWLIRSVDNKCKAQIKAEANDVGLTIGNYLKVLLGRKIDTGNNKWLIKGVSDNTKKSLITNARNRKMNLGQYLNLLAKNDEAEAEDSSKFQKIKNFIDDL